ncbi:unnamed protein product [marine sediment metagenome]|uniref:Uncharacterized protein n=1 Tax=marine sediment metagenome TaxID=412755 RepID=X1S739_9ZZZZ
MKKRHSIPIAIELVGISVVGVGIGLELAEGGAIYLVVITAWRRTDTSGV